MIRKAIIVVLTLGAVGMGLALAFSVYRPIETSFYRVPFVDGAWVDVRATKGRIMFGRFQERGVRLSEPIEKAVHRLDWVVFPHRCPLWVSFALPMVFATYPTIAFIRGPLRRHRRQRKGECIGCGYDLTGNESGKCPECGEAI